MLRECHFIMFRYVFSVGILLLFLATFLWYIYYNHSPKDLIVAGICGKLFLMLHDVIDGR